jgi:hypothetical protein
VKRLIRAAEALGIPKINQARLKLILAKAGIVGVVLGQLAIPLATSAATFSNAKVALSDPRPSQTAVTYSVTVSSVTSTTIKCIKADFSTSPSSSSAIGNSFTAAGASITAASSTLVNSSASGWTATPTANNITYTNASGITPSTTTGATFIIAGVNNSTVADTSYWLRFNTYNNTDCATSPVDNTVMGFIFTNGSTLSLTVDQTLTFTVNAVASATACDGSTTTAASTATTIPFGTVTSASNALVCQDLTASTNAANGYTIFARYTAAPTNGLSQTITDWTGTNAAPTASWSAGTEAYGYTTNDSTLGTGTANRFTNGGQKYAAMTSSNAEVAYEAAGVTSTTYRVGHQVGVATVTRPGTYTTTIIYTCTPIF